MQENQLVEYLGEQNLKQNFDYNVAEESLSDPDSEIESFMCT